LDDVLVVDHDAGSATRELDAVRNRLEFEVVHHHCAPQHGLPRHVLNAHIGVRTLPRAEQHLVFPNVFAVLARGEIDVFTDSVLQLELVVLDEDRRLDQLLLHVVVLDRLALIAGAHQRVVLQRVPEVLVIHIRHNQIGPVDRVEPVLELDAVQWLQALQVLLVHFVGHVQRLNQTLSPALERIRNLGRPVSPLRHLHVCLLQTFVERGQSLILFTPYRNRFGKKID